MKHRKNCVYKKMLASVLALVLMFSLALPTVAAEGSGSDVGSDDLSITTASVSDSDQETEGSEFTNVALGKTVTETTTTPSKGPASAIVNGLIMEESGAAIGWPTTYWNGGDAPASFTIDLGAFYEINKFVAYPFWDKDYSASNRYYNYKIYTSVDGVSFTEKCAKTDTTAETPKGTEYPLSETVKARYVKVEMTGSNVGTENGSLGACHMVEFEVYGQEVPEFTNVALGKAVTETTTTPSKGPASAIVNGLIMEESGAAIGWPTTYWNGGDAPASFTIDLGAFYEINKFVAYPFWDKDYSASNRYYNYKIYTSVDGVSFTEKCAKTDTTAETPKGTEYPLSETVKARYVKVEMTGSNVGTENGSLGACHMVEFEVYGRETAVRVEPKMSLSETNISLPLNSTKQLSVTATDEWGDAVTDGISWASSDSEIAEVDGNGLVTPKASGDVVITASYAEYELSVTCSIHVYDPYTESVNVALGKELTSRLGAGGQENANLIVDGNIAANGWPIDYWTGGASPASFTIDLGQIYAIDKFVAYPYWDKGGSDRYYNYKIYTSVDGVNFIEKFSKTDTTPETIDGTEYPLTEAVKAQYVKVEMTESNQGTQYCANGWAHMVEFEVYGREVMAEPEINLNKTNLKLPLSSTVELSAIVTDQSGEEITEGISWESSNPAVAEVDKNGLVTPKASGDVVITASYPEYELSASCNIHVFDLESGEYKEVLQNVALNKPVTASVEASAGQNPVLITDGNINNYWDGGEYPAFFIIDLGDVYEIEKFVAYPYFSLDGTRYYQYEIETSVNGLTYEFAAEKKDTVPQTENGDTYLFEQPRAVRYIKVTMTYCSSTKWVHMNEFAAYAKQYVEPVESKISVNKFALRMPVEGETTLTAEATDKWGDAVSDITFESNNESIVTVDKNGLVTAVSPGKTAITVSSTACGKSVTVEVEVYDPETEEDEIKIVAYWAPMSDYTNDEQYDYISEANFNWVMSMQNNLGDVMRCVELCAARGMEYIGIDCDLVYQTNKLNDDVVKQAVDRYKYLTGFGGFYHKDEPHPGTELDYVGVIKQIKNEWPETYVHMNFLASPSYDNYYDQTGLTFEAMLDGYASALGSDLDYLMFDLYPFRLEEGSFNATWYSNMDTIRRVGLTHDAKTATYIQSIGGANTRRPTGEEIGYEVAAALAYGCKQIAYYTYFEPYSNAMGSEQGSKYSSAIIDKNGNKTDLYEPVKEINRQIMTLSPTLINLDAVEVYHAGQLDGQAGVPEDFFAQAADGNKVILSHMQDKETGKNYLMVVNKDFTNAQDITITLDSDIAIVEEISKEDGNTYVVENSDGSISMTFTAGEGKLFALTSAEEAAGGSTDSGDQDSDSSQESTDSSTDSGDQDSDSSQESTDSSTDSGDQDADSSQESTDSSTDSSDQDADSDQGSEDENTGSDDQNDQSEQTASPNTGDDSVTGGYLALLAAAVAGIIALILERKRRAAKF